MQQVTQPSTGPLAPPSHPVANPPNAITTKITATKPPALTSTAMPASTSIAIPNPVESSIEEFKMFISFVFSVSIFGASTFAVVVGQMTDPADLWKPDAPPFALSTVRTFLAIAWLCFILSIAVAGYSSSLLTIRRHQAGGVYDETWGKKWDVIGILASAMLHLLLVTAFLFLSLSMVPYADSVGWVAVGFSCLAYVFVIGLTLYQFWSHLRRK